MDVESLYNKISVLPIDVKKSLAFRIIQSIDEGEMGHEDRCSLLVSKAEVATGHELDASKTYGSTLIRRFVSTRLRKEGYGWSEIGRLIGRDHATVIKQVSVMNDILSLPQANKQVCSQFKTFNDLVDQFDNS